jgi:hypothetical protein
LARLFGPPVENPDVNGTIARLSSDEPGTPAATTPGDIAGNDKPGRNAFFE